MSEKLYGSAIGKIILIGEHSVVYNKPAIAIPFNAAKIDTYVKENSNGVIINTYAYDGKLETAPESLEGLKQLIPNILNQLNVSSNIEITIKSTIPAERGMGSSAAVSGSVTRGLFNYFKYELSESKLLELVNFHEKIVHGNPSGIDSAIIVREEPLYFIKNQPFEHFDVNLDAYLVVADTGIKGQTKYAVSSVREYYESSDDAKNLIDELEALVIKSKESIINKDINTLSACMNQAQVNLKSLGVSNDVIDNLCAIAIKNGAYSAKLTGGGLGGCIIALCNEKNVSKVMQSLLDNGAVGVWSSKLSEGEFNES